MPGPDRSERWHAPRNRAEFQAKIEAGRTELEAQLRDARRQFDETQERINARTGRNLLFATVFGLGLGLAMLFSLIFFKAFFLLIAAFVIVPSVIELAGALRSAGRDVPRIPSVAAALLALPVAYFLPGEGQWWGIVGAVALVSVWRLAEQAVPRKRTSRDALVRDLGAGAFIQLYVTFLGSFAVVLVSSDGGEWWTLAFLILVIVSDVGAYATGLAFGKHPMAPRISPKKTWEGLAGAVLSALFAGLLLAVFMLGQEWWVGLLFGFVIVAMATLGDLAESLIKRDLGVKDISSWLPGHGGFLDRIDSILPSAAAAYALYLVFA